MCWADNFAYQWCTFIAKSYLRQCALLFVHCVALSANAFTNSWSGKSNRVSFKCSCFWRFGDYCDHWSNRQCKSVCKCFNQFKLRFLSCNIVFYINKYFSESKSRAPSFFKILLVTKSNLYRVNRSVVQFLTLFVVGCLFFSIKFRHAATALQFDFLDFVFLQRENSKRSDDSSGFEGYKRIGLHVNFPGIFNTRSAKRVMSKNKKNKAICGETSVTITCSACIVP